MAKRAQQNNGGWRHGTAHIHRIRRHKKPNYGERMDASCFGRRTTPAAKRFCAFCIHFNVCLAGLSSERRGYFL
uniref:Ribosomal protein L37 n=1 Tax=Globodera rostochiensis TaxID=31243 RepID=A0A914HH12_GLORO